MYAAAADAGDAESSYFCGDILEHGRGVAIDKRAAKHYYKRAADAGHAWGQTALGWMLEHGDGGGSSDVAAAVQLYKAASLQGHLPAQYHLACIYLAAADDSSSMSSSSSSTSSLLVLQTVNDDKQQQATKFLTAAHDLFSSAAKNGFVPAQVQLLMRMTLAYADDDTGCLGKRFNGRQRLFSKR